MSTNYYYVPTYTDAMKFANIQKVLAGVDALVPKRLHIGKYTQSVQFIFRAHETAEGWTMKTYNAWISFLSMMELSGHIEDERGNVVAFDVFKSIIDQTKKRDSHYDMSKQMFPESPVTQAMWKDNDGWTFNPNEFE